MRRKESARTELAGADNREAFHRWHRYASTRYVQQTLKCYSYSVEKFLDYWQDRDLGDLKETDVWKWVDHLQTECRHRQYSGLMHNEGWMCHKGHYSKEDALPVFCNQANCAEFEPPHPSAVGAHLKAVVSFYRYLKRRGYVEENPVEVVMQDFARDFPERKHLDKRRQVTLDEVKTLVNGTAHPRNKFLYALLAKTGIRIGEALALTTGDVDAENRRIHIKSHPKRGGKCVAFIDRELLEIYLRFTDWWSSHVKRNAAGKPATDVLFVSELTGEPLHPASINKYVIRNDVERLDLCDWDGPKNERITPHCFRHFFTGILLQQGCQEFYIKHLRGDVIKDVIGQYHDPSDDELQEVYEKFMPLFGIH